MQTQYWLFTCFAQWDLNNDSVDCRNNLLITKENNCKLKARAKFRYGPHCDAGWIHSFVKGKGSRNENRSANTALAPTVSYHNEMSIIYSNKVSRIIMVSAWNILVLLFIIILLFISFLMSYYSNQDGSLGFSIIIIALIPVVILLDWFLYFRYIFNYNRVNRGIILSIDPDSKTLEVKKSLFAREKVQKISEVTLVMHENAEREFPLPQNQKEKIFNVLGDGPRGKSRNIWYIQIKTEENNVCFLTPLMLRLKDLPFENVKVSYLRKPLIKRITVANTR